MAAAVKRRSGLILLLLFLLLPAGCRTEPQPQPPTATAGVRPTGTATPTSTPAPGAAGAPTPTPTRLPVLPTPAPDDESRDSTTFGVYGSPENGLVVDVPSNWRVFEDREIRLAPQSSLLITPRIAAGQPLVFIYTAATDGALLGVEGGSAPGAAEMAANFLRSGRLSALGQEPVQLLPFEETLVDGRATASGAVRLTGAEGIPGVVYLTAIVEGERRALVVAVTAAGTDEAQLNLLNSVAASVTFLDENGIILRTGRLSAGDVLRGSWDDDIPTFTFPQPARTPILFLLIPEADDNPRMSIRDSADRQLAGVDWGSVGEAEALRFAPERTGNYGLTISAPGSSGPFTLYAIDLTPLSGSQLDYVELEANIGAPAEYTFAATAGFTYIIYVEPIGLRANAFDVMVDVLDVAANTVSRVDSAYQGEAELILFTPAVDGTVALRIADFFGDESTYGLTLATLPAE